MAAERAVFVLAVAVAGGCGAEGGPARARGAESPGHELPLRPVRAVPGEPAPSFRLATTEGRTIDSEDLMGSRAMMLVFFATWCPHCDRQAPLLREIAEENPEIVTVGISLDGEDTWDDVTAFAAHHRLDYPMVRGLEHRSFVLSYDPRGSIPCVVVVGRDGRVVDVQIGHDEGQAERLTAALAVARGAPPLTSAR